MLKVSEYTTESGVSPFGKWFGSLNFKAAAKVTSAVTRMELGNFGDHKSVGGSVFERRIDFGPGYRIYYAKDGDELVILFYGSSKKNQQSAINKAKSYFLDYKKRKNPKNRKQGKK